nr:hypothetical protein [Tanacetum cinerariifolium]
MKDQRANGNIKQAQTTIFRTQQKPLNTNTKGPGFVLGKGSWDRGEMGEWWNGAGNTGERGCEEWREN